MEFPRSLSRRNVVNPLQYYRLRFLLVGFGALLPARDLRRQRHRDLAMGCSGKMDPVPLQEIPRYHWVVNNDADLTPPQSINDGRNISGALLLRPAETEIIGARLQDDGIGVVGDSAIDAAEHAGGSITDDAGTGDHSIDAALLEDRLQSCREGILCTNAPTCCIAGANYNNVERTGMTGPDTKDEHRRYRKSAHYGHHGLALRNATIVVLSPVIDSRFESICVLAACPLRVDAVEKGRGMPPARNYRISGDDILNRSCAFHAGLESILLGDPSQNPFSTASVKSGQTIVGQNLPLSAVPQ